MKKEQMRNSLLLLLTAAIWGVAFVAQSVGMDYVGPFTFNGVRSLIGGIVLLPLVLGKKRRADAAKAGPANRRTLLLGGVLCGAVLFAASSLQQIGIQYTTVGKAGFITACYIVIVPLLGLAFGKRCGLFTWLAVALALLGLYLLCITETLSVGKGDLLMLGCALLFSVHILVIDFFSPRVDGVAMSCIQFFICALLSAVPVFVGERPQISAILAAWAPVLYAGVLSCGVAYTLQIVGQKGMNPTVASLILSLESCISVLAGWLILGQRLSGREILGCLVMFAAIVLAQLPQKRLKA